MNTLQNIVLMPESGGDECRRSNHFNPDITYGCFTDERDGNKYRTVNIDKRNWMAENLNWAGNNNNLGWCYANNPDNCAVYGRLYDWATVMGFSSDCNQFSNCDRQVQFRHRGICPEGWRVPTDAEWSALVNFAGTSSVAGASLKAAAGWESDNTGTDEFGFSALPGGFYHRPPSGTNTFSLSRPGYWWSATPVGGGTDARAWWLRNQNSAEILGQQDRKSHGGSLRCVLVDTSYTIRYYIDSRVIGTTPASQTVNVGDSVALASDSGFSRNGYTFVGWVERSGTSGTVYSAGASFTPTGEIGDVTLSARWSANTDDIVRGTFVDARDGREYRTVVIGNQTWMAENLNFNASGSLCYGNRPDSCAKYGRLYTWSTVMAGSSSSSSIPSGVRGVCPAGWHVPSDAEWTTLTDFVGGASSAGTELKSTSGWRDDTQYYFSGNGTDAFGFSALPGGGYSDNFSYFNNAGYRGCWWSATEYDASYAWQRYMINSGSEVVRANFFNKSDLFALRCARD
jgi:uncharacterized protein (TIGR02145 family)/uncharacterized repeat protein (TIGR02543 family)